MPITMTLNASEHAVSGMSNTHAVAEIASPNTSGFDAYGNAASADAVEITAIVFESFDDGVECLDPFQCYGVGGLAHGLDLRCAADPALALDNR